MATSGDRYLPLARLAVGFNAVAALGCVALIAIAHDRAGAWLAGGGLAFFGLAAAGFATMLRLRGRAALTTSRDAAAERRAG